MSDGRVTCNSSSSSCHRQPPNSRHKFPPFMNVNEFRRNRSGSITPSAPYKWKGGLFIGRANYLSPSKCRDFFPGGFSFFNCSLCNEALTKGERRWNYNGPLQVAGSCVTMPSTWKNRSGAAAHKWTTSLPFMKANKSSLQWQPAEFRRTPFTMIYTQQKKKKKTWMRQSCTSKQNEKILQCVSTEIDPPIAASPMN